MCQVHIKHKSLFGKQIKLPKVTFYYQTTLSYLDNV